MQRTSALYRAEVAKPIAAQGYIRITFGVTDTDAAATCGPVETTAGTFYSQAQRMLREDAPKTSYATFEPGRMRLDKGLRIPPHPGEGGVQGEGFVSAGMSGADGRFAEEDAPALRLEFSRPHTVPGFTFTFDEVCGEWPCEMLLRATLAGETVLEARYEPNAAVYTTPDAAERFDGLEVRFLKTAKPWRRVRVQQLMFGFGLVFENGQVEKAVQRLEVDPIGRRLPVNVLEFAVVNVNPLTGGGDSYLYDPDNAQGIYRYISEQNPVKVEYGQYLPGGMRWSDAYAGSWGGLEANGWKAVREGGVTEWIPGGRYYLTGQPVVDGLTARFKARDALSALEGVYRRGRYAPEGRSLYRLALDVLEDSGLAPFGSGVPWKLWEGLAEITSCAPLPVKKHRECLQLIAHAGCCVLYTDREGYIRIEPAGCEEEDFRLDFDQMLGRPKVSQIPTLLAVECPAYSYAPEADESELHRQEYEVDGELTVRMSYEQAAQLRAEAAGDGVALAEARLYAAEAELVLRGRGKAEVTVLGKKLQRSGRTVTAPVESPDENGSVEALDNPLVTEAANALAVAEWVRDWLLLRNTYEFEYRGSPEVDAGDVITLESQFAPFAAPARVLKNELTFAGGLRGKMAAKRMVNE